jgi:hypothetical protein
MKFGMQVRIGYDNSSNDVSIQDSQSKQVEKCFLPPLESMATN